MSARESSAKVQREVDMLVTVGMRRDEKRIASFDFLEIEGGGEKTCLISWDCSSTE